MASWGLAGISNMTHTTQNHPCEELPAFDFISSVSCVSERSRFRFCLFAFPHLSLTLQIRNLATRPSRNEPLPCSPVVDQVIDYCKYHKDNPPEEIQKPLKSTNLVECGVSEWDSEYVNIEQEALPVVQCRLMLPRAGDSHVGDI